MKKFLVIMSLLAIALVGAWISQAMWQHFIPKFFRGAVKEGLIEAEVSYGVFFSLSFITVVLGVVIGILMALIEHVSDRRGLFG